MTKILIVEDSKTQSLSLNSTLEDAGFEVMCAENGYSGLKLAKNNNFDLIISDIDIPDINGYEFIRKIKTDAVLKDVPIILLSHLNESKDVIMGLESLADSYIAKPFTDEELLSSIDFLLSNPVKNSQEPLSVVLDNTPHSINSNPKQILNFLLSTYETVANRSEKLLNLQSKLRSLKEQLEQKSKQLEEAEIRFHSLVETIPDIVYRIDEDGYIMFINKHIRKLGYEPEALIGTHFSELIAPDQIDRISRKTVLSAMLDNPSYRHLQPKFFDERRSGERKTSGLEVLFKVNQSNLVVSGIVDTLENIYVDMEINSSGLYQLSRDNNNAFIGTVGVIRDISEKKQAERHVKTALQQAASANRVKYDFLSAMSHELRTPLNAILGFSQLLRTDIDNPLSADHADSIREIHHAGEHLLNLINDILDLAEIESGKLFLEYETVSPTVFLSYCHNMIEILAKKKDINFYYEVPSSCENCLVCVDLKRIKQVVLNLLSNAVKYNRHQGSVTLKCDNLNDEFLRISIIDTGIGIAKNDLEDIFKPFSRAEKCKYIEGTGIGLAISKELVESMEGQIGIDSELDKGTTFYIDLPIVAKN